MKAMVYRQYGRPSALSLEELPLPMPGQGEIRVKVMASSVNSWDWDLLLGNSFIVRMGSTKPRHPVLGADVAGVVDAVGKGVTAFAPGDAVFGDVSPAKWGGFGEYLCASAKLFAAKSPRMSFQQAAALPQAGVLALQGLRHRPDLGAGMRVLLHGAGGGVGTLALQMAKHAGAHVTVVDRTEKLALLQELGADETIDYQQTDWFNAGRQYDLILDVVMEKSLRTYRSVLHRHGRLALVGGHLGRIFQVLLFGPLLSLCFKKHFRLVMHTPNRDDLEELTRQFESGIISPIIEKVYPLAEVPEALQRIGDGLVQGKLVINVSEPLP